MHSQTTSVEKPSHRGSSHRRRILSEYRDVILNGDNLVKYSFSDSRAIKRFFWLSSDCSQLCWGTHHGDLKPLTVCLEEVVGVVFGPSTTTFSRLSDPVLPWCCFSLIFVGRTLDISTVSDSAHIWFLGLQELIGLSDWDIVKYREILRRKVYMKICYKAFLMNRSLSEHFRVSLQESYCSRRTHLMKAMHNLRKELIGLRKYVAENSVLPIEDLHVKLMNRISKFSLNDQNEIERKKLHNELMDLKGNIRVFARLRGPIQTSSSVLVENEEFISVYNINDARTRKFRLDHSFGPESSQTDIFSQVAPFVQSAMDGYNVCVFAYGATGGGKTYTMEGTATNPGINYRAISKIFSHTSSVDISIMQVYNEQVFDLLGENPCLEIKPKTDRFILPGIVSKSCHNAKEAMHVIAVASRLRTTNKTNINETSSRSHCIVTLRLAGGGCLNLIDLAGSENVNKSGAKGTVLKEAQNINKSLASLGDVIHQLLAKNTHIAYRNSKLTMILRESLAGNSKTLMIVQVSPEAIDIPETIGSLSFGTRVRTVELGKASVNKTVTQIRE